MTGDLLPAHKSFRLRMLDEGGPLRRGRLRTLQVNLGKVCNQACEHCHVEAGPHRTESMDSRTADRVIDLLRAGPVETVDLTGGAPELNPHFRRIVTAARAAGRRVIDRCNLTVLFEPEQETLAGFLASQAVEVVASLPCYLRENVDRQRGIGVWEKSIGALKWLNSLGYGCELPLHLVYNPLGPYLPPPQPELEAEYRDRLRADHGISFTSLFVITNMPIRRFLHLLERERRTEDYMSALEAAFNPATLPALMCRDTLSVGWDGRLYDCDFNQMLDLSLGDECRPHTVWDLDVGDLEGALVRTANHCYGCTAGPGSSCAGTLV